jgi:hypothetical protein
LNWTAAAIWPAMVGGVDQSDLVELLVERCNVPSKQAEEDVDSFLTELAGLGLLEGS